MDEHTTCHTSCKKIRIFGINFRNLVVSVAEIGMKPKSEAREKIVRKKNMANMAWQMFVPMCTHDFLQD